eukprot:gb/GEZN01013955.1/.p1 GENE.gb/GEZN01013955.1/~~gb/GEZN01013955.1/.p1  ORF type:complete len:125 (-),score=17.16 gb/GEZN01013955.1/:423-797(-)
MTSAGVIALVGGIVVAGIALGSGHVAKAAAKINTRTGTNAGAGYLKRYYNGGFEKEMTRREAALIIGIRESSTPEVIMAKYRKLMIKNHPDRGGSPFLSAKVNEAKELLMKRARKADSFARENR